MEKILMYKGPDSCTLNVQEHDNCVCTVLVHLEAINMSTNVNLYVPSTCDLPCVSVLIHSTRAHKPVTKSIHSIFERQNGETVKIKGRQKQRLKLYCKEGT